MEKETRNAYGERLAEVILENKDLVVLDADLTKSTKTNMAKEACPERHINAGIAEANMMGMAAGLAASGKTVFASSFAVFATGRAFEIVRNSICYPNLNVKICATHAGLSVGEDGATHQALEDIAVMRALPNMKVYVPCDQYETKAMVDGIIKKDGPCYVRLGRGKVADVYDENTVFDIDKINVLNKGNDICLIACGLMVQEALKAKDLLKEKGIEVTVADMACLKPADKKGVEELLKSHSTVYTLEEHNIYGGLFSTVAEIRAGVDCNCKVIPIGVEDKFGESGKMVEVLKKYSLDAESIVEKILK